MRGRSGALILKALCAVSAFLIPTVGLFGSVAYGQATSLPPVPSVVVLKGALVSPSSAATYYGGATTSTNGLCAVFPSNTDICTTSRAPEIKELSRGLRGDPNLIYEYVRNSIDTEFEYGLQKGAVGATIDGSGTAFDQAQLLVELLRESGFTASYKLGTISPTPAQFTAWTGLSDAKAACELLALGGIPATINNTNSETCAYSGALTSVTLAHVWVEAVVNGGTFLFDPSYKPYAHLSGIDVKSGMGFVAGQALSAAGGTTGTQNGVPYVNSLNQAALATKLDSWSTALLARVRQSDMQGASMSDLVGGRIIEPAERPSGGWKQTALPYPTGSATTWSGSVPNQYRTKLAVGAAIPTGGGGTTTVLTERTFYVDEIYGRRLEVASTRTPNPNGDSSMQGWQPYLYKPTLVLDGVALDVSSVTGDPGTLRFDLTLKADHPFAAFSGGYADAVVGKRVDAMYPATIVNGWGATSPNLAAKWAREQGSDRYQPVTIFGGGVSDLGGPQPTASGDLVRARMAANWLAQFSREFEINAELANSRGTHLHTLGVVSSIINYVYPTSDVPPAGSMTLPQTGFSIADETSVVDLESAFGLVSRVGSVTARRAAVHTITAVAATLEGTVAAELTDSPDSVSTARRFAWGNSPESGETPDISSRKSFNFAAGSSGAASGLVLFEGLSTGVQGWYQNQIPIDPQIASNFKTRLYQTIDAYSLQGFQVVASSEALLGPGHRQGTEYNYWTDYSAPYSPETHFKRFPTTQAGGALIATMYDASGDPVQIAHVLTRDGQTFKGGGGSSIFQSALYDPKTAADLMKDKFVDRSSALGVDLATGAAGYTSPELSSIGAGEFPYRLDRKIALRGGAVRTSTLAANENPLVDNDNVVTNWDGSAELSSSTLEGLGASRLEPAVSAIVAFVAMQDIWASSPTASREVTGVLAADWWGQKVLANVVTVLHGGSSEQFLKIPDGSWIPAAGGAAKVTVAGQRVAVRPLLAGERPDPNSTQVEATTRVWRANTLQISATGAQGDVKTYAYWEQLNGGGTTEAKWTGFRLATWAFPQGVTLTLAYGDELAVPTAVVSSLGQTLSLPTMAESPCILSMGDNAYGPVSLQGALPTVSATDDGLGVYKVSPRGPLSRSTSQRPDERCPVGAIFTPNDTTVASTQYTYDSLGRIKEARDALAIRQPSARGPHQFFIAERHRGERQDPVGGAYAVEWLRSGRLTRNIDELNRIVVTVLDGRRRVLSRTYPEGDAQSFVYDARDNMVTLTSSPKPGSGLANIVLSATWNATWNKPASITDPLGRTTSFTYVASGGGASLMATATRPDPDGAGALTAPVYSFTYNALGQPLTMTDPTGVVTANSYNAQNFLATTTLNPGGVNATTSFTYDALGDVVSVDGPRTDVTDIAYTTYDAMRRKRFEIGPDPDGAGALLRPVVRTTYDVEGQVTQIDKGSGSSTTGSDFAVLQTLTTVYDPVGNKLRVNTQAGVTQFAYDGANRTTCTAVRMNPAVYASLPGDACTLGVQGANGPDRITKTTYDLAGQALTTVQGLGTADQRTYATYTYSPNGQQVTVADARNNRSTMEFDGFDRLVKLRLPSTTVGAGVSSTTDYEAYTWNAAGERTSVRKRDGQVIGYGYDTLGREILKDIPGGTAADVYTSYDAAGRITSMRFASTGGSGIVLGYDTAGRMVSESTFGKTMAYQYDPASNRTRVTWPDAFYAQYSYDALGRMKTVGENGAISGIGLLASFAYDDLGRRTGLTRGNGTSSTYGYDSADRPTALTQDVAGAVYDQTYGFSWSPASQLLTRTASNAAYKWATPTPGTTANAYDGLNRDSAIVTAGGYDLRGNLTADGSRTFTYDVENRMLTAVSGGATVMFAYDPIGRLTTTATPASTTFLYDSDRLSAEYSAVGAVLRRYVHGPGVDEPLVWYEGAGTTDRRWLHQDLQGSVIAWSNGSGTVSASTVYKYGPWGEPGDAWGAGSRFRYTGQIAIPEAKLYHYKARMYDPATGRFMQTDPIGYKDDLDLYAYVGGDPVNRSDPTGEEWRFVGDVKEIAAAVPTVFATDESRQNYVDVASSRDVYTILADPDARESKFERDTKTIIWNPTLGLHVGGGVISSSTLLGHEIDHAADDANGTSVKGNFLIKDTEDGGISIQLLNDEEREAGAMETERGIARAVGEPERSSHGDGQPVEVRRPSEEPH